MNQKNISEFYARRTNICRRFETQLMLSSIQCLTLSLQMAMILVLMTLPIKFIPGIYLRGIDNAHILCYTIHEM